MDPKPWNIRLHKEDVEVADDIDDTGEYEFNEDE